MSGPTIGWPPEPFGPCRPHYSRETSMPTTRTDYLRNRIEAHEAAIRRNLDRLAQLEAYEEIEEPTSDDADVVFFRRVFGDGPSGRTYTYAAVRAESDGLWYTTGPQSPKGYTWQQLTEWLVGHTVGGLWLATEWEELA